MIAPRRSVALTAATALVVALSLPPPAGASSCCMSATAVGIGRLLSWERFALGLQASMVTTLGYYGTDGAWRRSQASYSDYQGRADLWALVDVGRHLSLWGDLPLLLNRRVAGELGAGYGGGLGELQLGARWDVAPLAGFADRPGFALTFAVTAPTGHTTADALTDGDVLGTSVTGRGAWVLAAGGVLEKTTERWFVRAGLGATVPLPARRADSGQWQRFGPGLVGSLVAGGPLVEDVVLSGVARLTWEYDLTLDGAVQPGTAIVDPGVGVALSWRAQEHVTLQVSLDTNLFVDWMGRNSPGRVTAALGVRYGYF